jgi:hypothetical protein
MIALRLIPQATKIEGGRWRPEVLIAHESGDQSVWGTSSVASHAEAFALAQRLVATALAVEEPAMLELPPSWK